MSGRSAAFGFGSFIMGVIVGIFLSSAPMVIEVPVTTPVELGTRLQVIRLPHPAASCMEDEVWWWIANDLRDCVPLDDIPINPLTGRK